MEKIIVSGYEVLLGWDPADRIYVAECPTLPGCMSHGETQEAAAQEMVVAIQGYLSTAKELGRAVPSPMRVWPPVAALARSY